MSAMRVLHVVPHMEGHVRPNLAIAQALANLGHDVAVAAPPQSMSLVEAGPCKAIPMWSLADQVSSFQRFASGGGPRDAGRWLVESHFTSRRLRAELEDTERIIARWQPDVLVFDQWAGGSQFVLPSSTGLPSVLFAMTLFSPFTHGGAVSSPAVTGGRVTRRARANTECALWRATLRAGEVAQGVHAASERERRGLESVAGGVEALHSSFDRILVSSFPGFDPCVLPENAVAVGPLSLDEAETSPEPRVRIRVEESLPLVCAGLSSVHFHKISPEAQLKTLLLALADLPVEAVVSTSGLPLEDRAAPPNVRLERWVRWGEILPQAQLVITNGGAGTVGGALSQGLPLVVLPLHSDQHENAWRVEDRGLGVRLPADASASRLKSAVASVLADGRYRQNCERLSRQILGLGGAARAAKLIEELG